MRKYLALFFFLLSLGTLSAQNINFKDTNALKTLLCSHTWIRYYVNPDSTFSDKVMDSIKFYPNGRLYRSRKPKDDTSYCYIANIAITGSWHFASTAKVSRSDTATNCISMDGAYIKDKYHIIFYSFSLFDGHRMKGTKMGRRSGNLDSPFVGVGGTHDELDCGMSHIWQSPRPIKKAKPTATKHK